MNKVKKKILVTGGAGYIGSFTAYALKEKGYEVVIFDNLSRGHKKGIEGLRLVEGDLVTDRKLLENLFRKEKFEAILHFAALIEVGESVEKPALYFRNNVIGSLNLFEAAIKNGIDKLVFSSSAAVYGEPNKVPIKEEDSKSPTNPYGETKLMVERILHWFDKTYGLRSISIRYFNAAGAALDGSLGEHHEKETHLIPLAIKSALTKKEFAINGDDYPTPDGTCIRDYIHVLDLVEAHILVLEALDKGAHTTCYNAGIGKGYSVKEVVEMVKKVSGVNFPVKIGPRRPGDPARLVASPEKIKKELGFKPKYSDLKTIVETAWKWHKSHPKGYE